MPFNNPSSIRRTVAPAGLALCLLLTACAPATRVTLLPQADGRASAVEVRTGQGTQLLTQPYQVAKVSRNGEISSDTTTANQVREAHPLLIALQPLPPARFVLEFEPGSSQLTAASQAQIANVIAQARERVGGEIVVTGHTDRQGTQEANDKLSLERAQAIRTLLVERGFKAELIEAVGRGEREPLVATEDEVVEPRNRRAELLVR
ncbi:MAG: OmpA family protein [Hydrogenophaga sp.]|jgi:outer membrane protein OmpA-like peptidoglycan-associated protein|nr:OmpA family protein [Hydrogenophaga sp.]